MAPLFYLFALLSLITALGLAKIVSLPSNPVPSSSIAAIQALIQRPNNPANSHFLPPIAANSNKAFTNEHDLLDIVLVAAVDGKLHALNRTSGYPLWSMAASPDSSSSPVSLSPLIRTSPIDYDPDLMDETTGQEVYIIEPQSGNIYVMSTPSSPLQRFPFSVTELVDMSPFTFNADEGRRLFVGKKETSLLVLELETGRVKAVLNSECPWPDFDQFQHDDEIDLDELEGSKPSRPPLTEVYIGRTDYHLSIYTRPNGPNSSPSRIPTQNLTFSMYGPNKQDVQLQATYRKTRDDIYIQSLPNGDIMSFEIKSLSSQSSKADSRMLWYTSFDNPIVAVFDVLRKHDQLNPNTSPFVLLQPRPRLQDVLPNFNEETASYLPNIGSAYVGMIDETGSLFAMSSDAYPLVVFGFNSDKPHKPKNRLIEGGPSSQGNSVDEITRARKEREEWAEQCESGGNGGPQCFVGMHKLTDADERRMLRLLPGVPGVEFSGSNAYQVQPVQHHHATPTYPPPPYPTGAPHPDGAVATINDSHGTAHSVVHTTPSYPYQSHSPYQPEPRYDDRAPSTVIVQKSGFLEGALVTLLVGGLSFWFGMKKRYQNAVDTAHNAVQKPQRLDQPSLGRESTDNSILTGDGLPAPISSSNAPNSISSLSNNTHSTHISPSSSPVTTQEQATTFTLPTVSNSSTPVPPPENAATSAPPVSSQDNSFANLDDGDESGGEGEGDQDAAATPGKKKTRRGRRGKKKKAGQGGNEPEAPGVPPTSSTATTPHAPAELTPPAQSPSLVIEGNPKAVATPSLVVSETILGFGSHGTVVFQGSLQGRSVAVKRLLQDFVTLAAREVSILQESDDHPNVIRYYYQEAHSNFLYIALELCPASLADIIESPDRDQWRDIAIAFEPKKALKQITGGLRHLHGLKLVHRDIKPQNILISPVKNGVGSANAFGAGKGRMGYRMLISDFGLCKKLDVDQTSFAPTAYGAMAAGTVGWRAPEILRGEVKLDEIDDDGASMSSRGSAATVTGHSSGGTSDDGSTGGKRGTGKPRLTKSVDIFALGCLFYYTLTNGGHPFGDRYEREVNILKNAKNLEGLERFGEEGAEAVELISMMLDPEPTKRPDTTTCLLHPFFWDSGRRLNFLQDASDRFEIMCREPRDHYLIELEKNARNVVGNDWQSRLDKGFLENLGKFRKYDGKSVQDLLRALRNKKHHYQDLPDNVKRNLGAMPEGFLAYFTKRFPQLFLHVHEVIRTTGLRSESMFRSYFELPE